MQFLTFKGVNFQLTESLVVHLKIPNFFAAEPLDADLATEVKEINEVDVNYMGYAKQVVNIKQLNGASCKHTRYFNFLQSYAYHTAPFMH